MANKWWNEEPHDDDESKEPSKPYRHVPRRQEPPPPEPAPSAQPAQETPPSPPPIARYPMEPNNYQYSSRTKFRERLIRNRKKGTIRWVLIAVVVLMLGGVAWIWLEIASGLPTLDQLENPRPD